MRIGVFTHRAIRWMLVGLGVGLGVALLFGVLVANASVDRLLAPNRIPIQHSVTIRTSSGPLPNGLMDRVAGAVHGGFSAGDDTGGTNQVEVDLPDGVNVAAWIVQVQRLVGPGIIVEPYRPTRPRIIRPPRALRLLLAATAIMALLAGASLIYLTLSATLRQRDELVWAPRPLSATARQIGRLILTDALIPGAAGSGLGLVLGTEVAAAMSHLQSSNLHLPTPLILVHSQDASAAFCAGIGVTCVAAVPAELRAAKNAAAAQRAGLG